MNRKDFLKRIGFLTGGVAMQMGPTSLNALPVNPFKLNIEGAEGKILVLVQLMGGNDGLNTVVPIEDANYYNLRKNVHIKKAEALALRAGIGLHPSMKALKELYDGGKVSLIQNVGYEKPDRSHFRSTDIWLSASDSKQYLYDGWVARYLETDHPMYPEQLPEVPMAIQLGSVESMLLQGQYGSLGTVFDDPNLFYQLIAGSSIDNDQPPATLAGDELRFLRQVATASIQYSTEIKEAADKGKNQLTYPNTNLGRQLSIVAKLIHGGLATPMYLTTIGGFDTHANQLNAHANLLTQVSEGIANFQKDLQQMGLADQVVTMTFSEFGRRVKENDTAGTDHGSAAPMFVIGNTVKGGIIGKNPDLSKLDSNGDIYFENDFRQVYSAVIQDYFLKSADMSQKVLKRNFDTLPIFKANQKNVEAGLPFELAPVYPNPVHAVLTLKYTAFQDQYLETKLMDLQGRTMAVVKAENHAKGVHTANINCTQIPAGQYIVALSNNKGQRVAQKILVLH